MAVFPLPEGFFPPVALSADDASRYRRTSKERVAQLVRILEDAECAYQWTALPPNTGNGGVSRRASRAAASRPVVCHRAQFLDLRPTSKAASSSTLLKASALVADVRADEVLSVAAKNSTREFRRLMASLLGSTFVDGRTLATLPSSGRSAAHSQAVPHYRAIKWHCLETASPPTKMLDFVYLEYAGRRSPRPGSSSVVAFCVQTAVERPEVPVLPGVERCSLPRVGLIVSRVPHQRSTCRVTALCQLDSPSPELAAVMQRWVVASISRLNALLERQRVGRLRFVEQWQWIPNGERQACAVCLRGFFFHRKHHCRTCGEVVCSSCAPLRELEEPILDIPTLRVCSACLLSAAALPTGEQIEQSRTTSDDSRAELVSPRHDEYEEVDVALRGRARLGRALRPQDKLQVLTNVVSRIRDIRDTIDLTIAEVDEREPSDAAEAANARPAIEREHSEMRSIRDALESSVSRFDAALVRATTGDSEVERSTADRSTDDEFRSVARITLAAAHATQQAGQAFLSAGRAGRAPLHQDEDGAVLPPPLYREESSALLSSDDEDPYSAGNYEKLLARSTSGTGTDTIERPNTRSTQIRALEEQIRALQLSLEDAQRKLSVMESDPLDAPFGKENDSLYFHKENARALYPMYPEGDELVAELRGVMTDEPFADVVASPIAALPESESDFGWSPVKLTPPSRSPRPTKPRLSGATASSSPPSSLYQQRRVVTPQALGISDSGEPDDSDDLDDDSDDDDSERFEGEPQFRPPPSAMPPTFYVEESLRPAVPGRRSTARYSARPRSASLPGVDREERPVARPDQSEDGGTSGPTALYVDHALRALRSTLAALRCECPSAADRRRKLAAVVEVLSALRREGVRSRYRTLPHEEVHYAALMEKTPSVVKLLRIAGYVSLPHYLVMRRVDPEFLGLVLAELELETR